jgi:hypothetical protein
MDHKHSVIREGLIAGAAGAAAVAAWFLVLDLVQGRMFFTPGALGSIFFLGARSVEDVQITIGTVAGYTVLHLAAFALVGFVASWIFNWADEEPRVVLGLGVLLVVSEVFVLGMMMIGASWLLDEVPIWAVLISNALGMLAVGAYLWRVHPAMRANVRDSGLEEIDVSRATVQRGPPAR